MPVQEIDDVGVRERTRPQRKCASSTPSDCHPAVVREEKYRPVVPACQAEGLAQVVGPTNLIEPPFLSGWLQLEDALPHPR